MRSILVCISVIVFISALMLGCNKESSSEPQASMETCGDGQGYKVVFTKQVDHYEAGYGRVGEDVITVSCLVGPQGATVSNSQNGTYYCAGTYKLTTFTTAKIDLNWGGSTSYSTKESFTIAAKGSGMFKLKCTKTAGGEGKDVPQHVERFELDVQYGSGQPVDVPSAHCAR
jgi:hypothetical protein